MGHDDMDSGLPRYPQDEGGYAPRPFRADAGGTSRRWLIVLAVVLAVVALAVGGVSAARARDRAADEAADMENLRATQEYVALWIANEIELPEGEELERIEFTSVSRRDRPDLGSRRAYWMDFVVNDEYSYDVKFNVMRLEPGIAGLEMWSPSSSGFSAPPKQGLAEYLENGGSRGIESLDGIDVVYRESIEVK